MSIKYSTEENAVAHRTRFLVMDIEQLDFPPGQDSTFAVVWTS